MHDVAGALGTRVTDGGVDNKLTTSISRRPRMRLANVEGRDRNGTIQEVLCPIGPPPWMVFESALDVVQPVDEAAVRRT
jgi:hypothetical protein